MSALNSNIFSLFIFCLLLLFQNLSTDILIFLATCIFLGIFYNQCFTSGVVMDNNEKGLAEMCSTFAIRHTKNLNIPIKFLE